MPSRASLASLRQLGEFGLIQRLTQRIGRAGPPVLLGIGDDAAVIRMGPGRLLLLSTDLLAEGIHFDLATATMEEVGYKAAVGNLSDIAAMGGEPQYMLVALAIPAWRTVADVDELYRGLLRACRRHGVHLVGGDTSASPRGLFICITVTGISKTRRALTRDGARVGDLIYVTGTLGDSHAGLKLLRARRKPVSRAPGEGQRRNVRFLVKRHLRPTARVPEGQWLASRRLATATIDLSDGLSGDLGHLCTRSRVGAEIETASLPLSPACRWYARLLHRDPADFALAGGEDYELLFTVSPDNRRRVDRLAQRRGFRFTRIGTIKSRKFGIQVRPPTGPPHAMIPRSYRHFQHLGPTAGPGEA